MEAATIVFATSQNQRREVICRACDGGGTFNTLAFGARTCDGCHRPGFVETRWRRRQAITRAIWSAADAVWLWIALAVMVYVVFLLLGAWWPWGGTLGWLLQIASHLNPSNNHIAADMGGL